MNIFDYYEILGVHRGSSDEEIKLAHRRLSREYHPDKGGEDPVAFDQVQKAFKALKDATARHRHLLMMQVSGRECAVCSGRGVIRKTKGFTVVGSKPCDLCEGCGYISNADVVCTRRK